MTDQPLVSAMDDQEKKKKDTTTTRVIVDTTTGPDDDDDDDVTLPIHQKAAEAAVTDNNNTVSTGGEPRSIHTETDTFPQRRLPRRRYSQQQQQEQQRAAFSIGAAESDDSDDGSRWSTALTDDDEEEEEYDGEPFYPNAASIPFDKNAIASATAAANDNSNILATAFLSSPKQQQSQTKTPTNQQRILRLQKQQQQQQQIQLDQEMMSAADIEICQRLDAEYELALEERELSYMARSQSVRQSAVFSVLFMITFLTLGTVFFLNQADWTVADSLLFSIYTITTVGYGNLEHPDTASFQLYTIFFIFIGIATLTIMVAQVYQCLSLEASRAQHARDQSEMARRGMEVLLREQLQQQQRHPDRANAAESTATTTSSLGRAASSLLRSRAAAVRLQAANMIDIHLPVTVSERLWQGWERSRVFFRDHEIGKALSVVFPFGSLILIGALVIGLIEQWTPVESIYFAVVSLTTVGFGDYYPTRTASIWFCVFWLPFSVGFMSLYLANVAAFYIRLSDKNIARIERQLRRQMERAKQRIRDEQQAARRRALRGQAQQQQQPSSPPLVVHTTNAAGEGIESEQDPLDDVNKPKIPLPSPRGRGNRRLRLTTARRLKGFNAVPTTEQSSSPMVKKDQGNNRGALFGSSGSPRNRRDLILMNSRYYKRNRRNSDDDSIDDASATAATLASADDDSQSQIVPSASVSTMSTMKDVLAKIRRNVMKEEASRRSFHISRPESEFLSIRSSKTVQHTLEQQTILKPSFALRALVQERFSEIIAVDLAGYSSNIEIHENTLSVTIDKLKQTADKWLIPRRARKAFRAVTFEALYFVGEHGLVTRGADALFDLTPFEFHRLFASLIAAMGDAETMEGWLASTEVMADDELRGSEGGEEEASRMHEENDTREALDTDDQSLPSVT